MVHVSFAQKHFEMQFCNEEMVLTPSRALYWPRERAILVADLHLEKGSFYAAHGQMVPPYDSRETLARLADAVRETGARRVYSLGDSFHDNAGESRLEPYAAGMLDALTRSLDWVWITGNHDEELRGVLGGSIAEELEIGGILLRHEAVAGVTRPELSGHFHPKMRVRVRERSISRPCAVVARDEAGNSRMILPAFGAYTGGMDAGDPAILGALQPTSRIDAVLPVKDRLAQFPLWREVA